MTARNRERNRIVTFLTDFGTVDGYVAAMKGVVRSQAPSVCLVDAAHDIPPQDVDAGAWAIHQYWRFYPAGTLHVAVVDPGVGSERAALLAEAEGQIFLAPDNGLLSWVFRTAETLTVGRLRPHVHRPEELSNTFHGRDVFAYTAGLLASGAAEPDELVETADSYILGSRVQPEYRPDGVHGRIVHVDRFGNLISNITKADIQDPRKAIRHIRAGDSLIAGLSTHYAEAEEGEIMALISSAGLVEISVNRGSAQNVLGLKRGDAITIQWEET